MKPERFILILIYALLITCSSDDRHNNNIYHSPESLEKYLFQIQSKFPGITYLEPAGNSVEGRNIWALSISDNPRVAEPEPKVRLTGAIHGNENATTEVLVRFIDYILNEYTNGNQNIRQLINNTYIVIIPMMNPDGVALDSRYNANYVDLNRNFDIEWTPDIFHGSSAFSEEESRSIRDYSDYIVFHSSLTFHTGAVIVNMPFDYASEHNGGDIPKEQALVDFLAQEYTTSGRFLETPGLLSGSLVADGTINGGDWYIINGSLQDWCYISTGCIDLTVEISNNRPSTNEEIDELFELNRDSIIAFIKASGTGVYGKVTDSTGNPLKAKITMDGINTDTDIITYSDDFGYYHRLLLPGDYTIIYNLNGYTEHTETITITDTSSALRRDITLTN